LRFEFPQGYKIFNQIAERENKNVQEYLGCYHVIHAVVNSSERNNGTLLIPFSCMIENNIHDNLLQ
jgi:hypothetical protein